MHFAVWTLYLLTVLFQIAVCSAMQISQGNKTVKVTFSTKFYEKPKFPSLAGGRLTTEMRKNELFLRCIYFSGSDDHDKGIHEQNYCYGNMFHIHGLRCVRVEF